MTLVAKMSYDSRCSTQKGPGTLRYVPKEGDPLECILGKTLNRERGISCNVLPYIYHPPTIMTYIIYLTELKFTENEVNDLYIRWNCHDIKIITILFFIFILIKGYKHKNFYSPF